MVDMDAFEAEGGGAAARVAPLAVFPGTKQPEVGDNDEVNDVQVGLAPDWMSGVEAVDEGFDEEEVGRVGSGGGVVFIAEGLDERIE